MIAKERFGVPAEDFGKVKILNRNYPLIKTSPSDEVSKNLMQPISTIKNLIERGELSSFSGWVQKCFIIRPFNRQILTISKCYLFLRINIEIYVILYPNIIFDVAKPKSTPRYRRLLQI